MYTYTVPLFVKGLKGLLHVLEKAEEQHVDEASLLKDALAPDMFPCVRQIQIACDQAKGATARLASREVPSFPDTETTISELKKRIEQTIAFIESVEESAFEGADDRQITLPYFPGKYMTGFDYAREYAIPNFYFHVTVAYGLVRKAGVQIGKADFLNGLPLKDLT
jgi:hypothetical protein